MRDAPERRESAFLPRDLGQDQGEPSALFQVGVILALGRHRGAGLWDFPGLLCVFKCKPVRKRICGGMEIFVVVHLLFVCMCVYMEARGQLLGVSSVILLFVLGIKSVRQAWQQGALPPEPSRWPHPLV